MTNISERKTIPDANSLATEHADYIVKRLEQFIREGRAGKEGMSFKKWQKMAKIEIIDSILETKKNQLRSEKVFNIVTFVFAAAITTVGFWGAAVSLDKVELFLAGIICMGTGISVLLLYSWLRYQTFKLSREQIKRAASLKRISGLTNRIKKLERELEAEEKERQKEIDKIRRPHGKSLFESLM